MNFRDDYDPNTSTFKVPNSLSRKIVLTLWSSNTYVQAYPSGADKGSINYYGVEWKLVQTT